VIKRLQDKRTWTYFNLSTVFFRAEATIVEARQKLVPYKRNVFLDVPATSVLRLILVPAEKKPTFLRNPQILKTISRNSWGIPWEFLGNSWGIPGEFLGNSLGIPGEFLGNSWGIPGECTA
jgi:hypothetical protein